MSTSKSVLITGATRGLGENLARHCAARGYRLALTGRKQADLDRLAAELSPTAGDIVLQTLDVCDFAAKREARFSRPSQPGVAAPALQATGVDGQQRLFRRPFASTQAPLDGVYHFAGVNRLQGDALHRFKRQHELAQVGTHPGKAAAVIIVQDAPLRMR
jgi:NAD(P)-dependent dehydrogenase (short-subunit alcohol dehydrogenase family)